jgi:putative redox protein
MATVETTYLGELRTEATHVQSQNELITDAPVDNQGRGEAFSPTDLLSASLGSCMLTIMGIQAKKHNINIDNTKCSITKIMAQNPRRVGEIQIRFQFPEQYSEESRKMLENAALTCPVIESLHPDLVKTVDFGW